MVVKSNPLSFEVVLFQPEIAQNLGAIARLCTCFDIPLNVIEPCGFPFSSKFIKRAMMDYGEISSVTRHLNFKIYDAQRKRNRQKNRMILFTTKGTECLWDFDFCSTDHLFFGNEGYGVPENIAEKANAKVFIPMPGKGRSLNLAMSAGIALSEATRQLRSN